MKNNQIIYIMSDQRSGSTLLDNILSNAPYAISVGELRLLSDHLKEGKFGRTWNWECSCGQKILECPFWSKILNDLRSKGIEKIETTKINAGKEDQNETVRLLKVIYRSIFQIYDNEIIVDSSKEYYQAYKLYQEKDIKLKVVRVTRDVRAISNSKHKWEKKFTGKNTSLLKKLIACKLKELRIRNVSNKINHDDFIEIDYEELAKNPVKIVNKIIDKFSLDSFEIPDYMYAGNQHTIAGTPNRFKKRKIKFDDSWKKDVSNKPFFNFVGFIFNAI